MASFDKDSLGTRLKQYEAVTTQRRAFKGQPIVARLDGKSFHTFTKGLRRPFDEDLTRLMVNTTRYLVDRFDALVGYTQSDEITLVWFVDSTSKSEYVFDGRLQKFESLLAAACTAAFNRDLQTYLPAKGAELPIFDCRAFVVPNLLEAYHSVLWRQQDCTKNAVSMAAQSMFSHKSLQGLHSAEMQEKMFAERGVNFNDYPASFRRGTFARRMKVFKPMDDDLKRKLSAKGVTMPTGPIERSEIQTCNAWLTRLDDPVSFLFKGGAETYRASQEALDDKALVNEQPSQD